MSHSSPMLEADQISHFYGPRRVLADVSLRLEDGEILGLVGPNGSGKTTLLKALYGSISPTDGTVRVQGSPLSAIPRRKLAQQIAVVVQEPHSDLMLSVGDTVLLGRTPHLGTFSRAGRRDDEIASAALDRVGLLHMADRDFAFLSGGEKQRVLIARALTQEADCLLLDEPTNHLDISYQHQTLALVRQLAVSAVVVLHDLNLAARYCDKILMLREGRTYTEGRPEEVFTSEIVEPVYRIRAEAVTSGDGTRQLLFNAEG